MLLSTTRATSNASQATRRLNNYTIHAGVRVPNVCTLRAHITCNLALAAMKHAEGMVVIGNSPLLSVMVFLSILENIQLHCVFLLIPWLDYPTIPRGQSCWKLGLHEIFCYGLILCHAQSPVLLEAGACSIHYLTTAYISLQLS